MSARLEISIQYGGPIDRSGPVGVFGFGVVSRCAEGLQISGLDQRVKCLAFMMRMDGAFQTFEGEPASNVKVGKNREYISIDLLFKEHEYVGAPIHQIISTMIQKVQDVPPALHACGRTQRLVDAQQLSRGLEIYCERLRRVGLLIDPGARWVHEVGVMNPGATSPVIRYKATYD